MHTETNTHRRTKFAATLDDLCHFAVDMLGVAHSGFVRFDQTLASGTVQAHYPEDGFEGLLGRRIALAGVPAEQQLLASEEGIEILDVEKAGGELGKVADLLLHFKIKSLYIVKVKAHGRVIGSFSLDSFEPGNSFGLQQKALCQSLARLASLAIENALLLDWFEGFGKSTTAMISQQDTSTLPSAIATLCSTLFEVREAGLYSRLNDSEGEYLQMEASTVRGAGAVLRRSDRGMAWRIIDGSDPYLTHPNYPEYEHKASTFSPMAFGSVLEVPMLWQNERVGVFFLSDIPGRVFTAFDADLLRRFADIATLALQKRRLLGRVQMLSDASADFVGGLESGSLEAKLTQIAQHATMILGAEMCGVCRLRDPETLVLEASVGHRPGTEGVGRQFRVKDEAKSGLTGAIALRLLKRYEDLRDRAGERRSLVVNLSGTALTMDPSVKGGPDASVSGGCYSVLAVPLVVKSARGEKFLGILRLSNKKDASGGPSVAVSFNKEDEWVLAIFAHAAAIAIEGAELVERLDRSRARLQSTSNAVKLVAEALAVGDQRDALNRVVQGVSLATGCAAVTLRTKNSQSGLPILEGTATGLLEAARSEGWQGSRADDSVVGRLLRAERLTGGASEVHIAVHAPSDPIMAGTFVARERIVSSAAVRLLSRSPVEALTLDQGTAHGAETGGGAYVGVLFVNYRQHHSFSEEETAILELFGCLASVAVHNQQIYVEKAAEVAVQKALYAAALELFESLDLDSTLWRIAEAAYKVAIAAGRRVRFVDVNLIAGNSLNVVSAFPRSDLAIIRGKLGHPQPKDDGIVGRAFSSKEPLVVNNVKEDPDYIEIHEDTESELVAQLFDGDRLIGAVNVESPDPHCFSDQDKRTFQLFAALAAHAIRNSTQYEALARAQEEKKHLGYVTFYYIKAGVIAHLYRGNVPLIKRAVAELESQAAKISEQNPLSDSIRRLNSRLTELDGRLSSVQFDPSRWQSIPLNEILDGFLRETRVFAAYDYATVSMDASATVGFDVRLDGEMLNHVLHILGKNSAAAVTNRSLTITILTELVTPTRCRIIVEDNGAGIDPDTWNMLLEACIEPVVTGRSGIGLLTAALIVTRFRGVLEKVKTDGQGTTFAICLPRADT